MKHVACCTAYLCLALGITTAYAQPTPPPVDPASQPVYYAEPPVSQGTPELRDTGEDDARIAALEAEANRHPRAAYDLALRYFRGDGVQRNSYKALTWMRVAAEKGELKAQKALGRLYLTGLEEMGRDPREARTWLSLAASRGDRESKRLLAEAEAATRSDEEEYKWLNRQRPVVYSSWQSGYTYYGTWNGQSWHY